MRHDVFVYGDWHALGEIQTMGVLHVDKSHGKEIFAFEYSRSWLESGHAMTLDPQLQLYSGPQYLSDNDHPNFGLFLDSSPDRWGQLLMKRREARLARKENRRPRTLLGTDFLLGVHDEQRIGGLRFKAAEDGEFLSNDQDLAVPPWTRLRELENAAWRFQSDKVSDGDEDEWLRLLMAPGSSIGGARPKAGICDEEQNLWIAKFPGRNDEFDVGAWEFVTHQLAIKAGMNVAVATVEKFGRRHHSFIVKRFDRIVSSGTRLRRHFASAMTMLGYNDGTSFVDGASYLEIVEFLVRQGADVQTDLQELWRRIVFSICVSNCDDHLRNHGFLLQSDGWKLSPAYDINPDPSGTGLSLNISDNDNSLNLDLALEVSEYFRIDKPTANSILEEVTNAVAAWQAVATDVGISRREQEFMAPAFRVVS
jgi:serine/threonine-protein kinase HipA